MDLAEEADIGAYFERIGFAGSMAPTLETLNQLHQLHIAAIPFENLDPLIGAPVRLDLPNLQQKLLFDRRGGYCIEQNLLFKAVLESLDFPVRTLGARVLWGHAADEERPLSHLVLAVDVAGVSYLADVGFGGLTPSAPLRLRAELEQETPHERFRLLGGDPDWRLEVELGGEWKVLYAFEVQEMQAEAISAMNDFVSAVGTQRDNLIAARAEKGRRLALRNFKLNTHVTGGASEARMLQSVGEVKEVLTGLFGLALPADDRLDPALARILAREQAAEAS